MQAYRQPEALERWSTQRSVAVDALQLLVVLTTSVSGSVQRRGTVPAAVRNTGWLEHRHCCVVMDILGRCSDDPAAAVKNNRQECATLTDFNGRQCVAKTYVGVYNECTLRSSRA